MFYGANLNLSYWRGTKNKLFGSHNDDLSLQWIISVNKWIKVKYYEETKTRALQIQRVTRRSEIQRPPNNTTGNLKQKKNISWAPMDLATDESSGPNN